ncbi:PKD domain-containing protein [Marivirga aurantiaca]|nr:PKD domain-containing protein [Marivirga aurantiaca]
MKKTIYQLGLWSLILALVFACEEDPVEAEEPTASFQYEIGETDFLTVTFENFSKNYESSSWDFGDGSEGSTEENPVHTYEAAGTYDVKLTVTASSGETAERTESVEVTDPLAAERALIGEDGKTWQLLADPSTGLNAIQVGPESRSEIWFAVGGTGNQVVDPCVRSCIFDDTWTFKTDGTYTFENNGDFWAEGGVWPEEQVGCFDATVEGSFTGIDGADLSGWDSGTHEFTYDAANQTITINGGFIGLSKVATNQEVLEPQETVIYDVIKLIDSNVDTLVLETKLEEVGGYWQFTLVSYDNPADEVVVEACEPTECTPLEAISPDLISHSFASNDASEWNLMQPITSNSGIELGVDDPTDASAPKVGKFIRTAQQFQELQFKLDPANAINFESLTTITMDVYLPSTNDYSGDLTDNVFIGFGATECPPNWWEDLHQYEEMAIEKDTWVTVTFQLDNPSTVLAPDNGATVYDRNDLDMIYIQIGGGDHTVEAEFFVRNFSIE